MGGNIIIIQFKGRKLKKCYTKVDTVNIASRMESSGESYKINISGTTFELVKDKFNCIYTGKIEAKKKGMIDMYYVVRLCH